MAQKISGIYVILNTKNGKVYIGQAQDFGKRRNEHIYKLTNNTHTNRHLQSAWNKYGANAFKFQKLEYCEIEQLDEREQHHINIYMAKGMCYNIVKNVTSPGRGLSPSEETRRKMSQSQKNISRDIILKRSESNRGKKRSDEQRHRMSEAAKKRPPHSPSAEARRKSSEANRGRIVTAETRRKISEASRGRVYSDEQRQKMSESRKGRVVTSETRQKMSESLKGRVVSEETRRKIGKSNRGKSPTDEMRRKMSESAKNRPVISDETRRKLSEASKRNNARRRAQRELDAANATEQCGEV